MSTALDVAAAAVGAALAVSSTGIQVTGFNPLTITPNDAFTFAFSHFHTTLPVFRAHLVSNLPAAVASDIQGMNFDDSTIIQKVVDGVEAIILAM